MSSWIKLDRDVVKHWIFKDEWKFKCWIDLLVLANYSDNKVEIKGILFTCKRGELLYSLDSLSLRWNSNKSKVRRFLKLLESDSMIELKSEQVTTRITICKYDSYQGVRNEDETQTKHKRNEDETQTKPIKESKEEKEEKENINNKFNFRSALISFGFNSKLVSEWLKVRNAKGGINTETAFKKFISEVEKNGNDKNFILQKCVENSWKGFNSDWLKNETILPKESKDDLAKFKNKF